MTDVRKRPLRQALGATEKGHTRQPWGLPREGSVRVCVHTCVHRVCRGQRADSSGGSGQRKTGLATCSLLGGARVRACPPSPACPRPADGTASRPALGHSRAEGRAARRMCQPGSSQRGLRVPAWPCTPGPCSPLGRGDRAPGVPPRCTALLSACAATSEGTSLPWRVTRPAWSPPNEMALVPSGPITFHSSDSLK